MSRFESFSSDRVSAEYEASLTVAETQGFNDGYAGAKCQPRKYGFFGLAATLYGTNYKRGKSARL